MTDEYAEFRSPVHVRGVESRHCTLMIAHHQCRGAK